ncbi:prevent-host-death family protein [Trichococcus patagoniensis]|uniref:Antitoxin n=1 Tax=Trichococcus patagoniensis TaxID=382641 RepID=A0A2T5INW2_9LACT|nr:type II toxin-antitoxin system Phd/YefM family antitoxin [Trichococcus patagoniensis]PTQ85515.1 prevent-host-death family protein [Trichococcus patagoniensis]
MRMVNPSQARKIFYQLLKDVNESHEPVYISGKKEESEAVMVSKKDWDAIQETLYLRPSGATDSIRERKHENEFVALEDIDWDTL